MEPGFFIENHLNFVRSNTIGYYTPEQVQLERALADRSENLIKLRHWDESVLSEILDGLDQGRPTLPQSWDPEGLPYRRAVLYASLQKLAASTLFIDRLERGLEVGTPMETRLRNIAFERLNSQDEKLARDMLGDVAASYLMYDPAFNAEVRRLATQSPHKDVRWFATIKVKQFDAFGETYHEKARNHLAAIRAKWAAGATR